MHTKLFFKLFPPPKFLVMPHAGLDISDEAIRCIQYSFGSRGPMISHAEYVELPLGVIDGGDIKDEAKFVSILSEMADRLGIVYAKVSIPEEKAYLFQTDVNGATSREVEQNIEFKLEENVPLSASDAVFYFDYLPQSVTGGAIRASVSVVPRNYVEHYSSILRSAHILPVAFETVPKSIARAVIAEGSEETELIVHVMKDKTGIYIVSGGVVCFSSTIRSGSGSSPTEAESGRRSEIAREVNRVYSYWISRADMHSTIAGVIVVGRDAPIFEQQLREALGDTLPVHSADIWRNVFDINRYIPTIAREESFGYAVAAGLALNL